MTARSPEAPRHVAVIMDGNGRWAEARSLPRIRGHEHGVEAVRSVVRGCRRRGVEALTLYSFSAENWARPKEEVAGLMALLVRFLDEERREILDHGIRLVASGEIERLPAPARLALQGLMRASSGQAGMVLNLALSYGSRQEIVRAARLLADDAKKRRISPNDIDEAAFAARLYTHGLPDPDLVIRTGGERRLSNFLLFQAAYAELFVTDLLWPDFRDEHLEAAFLDFASRQRRFGRTGAQVVSGGA